MGGWGGDIWDVLSCVAHQNPAGLSGEAEETSSCSGLMVIAAFGFLRRCEGVGRQKRENHAKSQHFRSFWIMDRVFNVEPER